MSDMSRYDAERLHQLIANHARYTGSERAKDILADWNDYLPKFRKVMPVEYRRALAEMKAVEVRSRRSRRRGRNEPTCGKASWPGCPGHPRLSRHPS